MTSDIGCLSDPSPTSVAAGPRSPSGYTGSPVGRQRLYGSVAAGPRSPSGYTEDNMVVRIYSHVSSLRLAPGLQAAILDDFDYRRRRMAGSLPRTLPVAAGPRSPSGYTRQPASTRLNTGATSTGCGWPPVSKRLYSRHVAKRVLQLPPAVAAGPRSPSGYTDDTTRRLLRLAPGLQAAILRGHLERRLPRRVSPSTSCGWPPVSKRLYSISAEHRFEAAMPFPLRLAPGLQAAILKRMTYAELDDGWPPVSKRLY